MSNIIVSAFNQIMMVSMVQPSAKKKAIGVFLRLQKKARGPAEMEGARRSCVYALRLGTSTAQEDGTT